jgi:hypothetical protein
MFAIVQSVMMLMIKIVNDPAALKKIKHVSKLIPFPKKVTWPEQIG